MNGVPERPAAGHKGMFGMVAVVGGQDGVEDVMIGAPALAAEAALRSGCGRVLVVSPRSVLSHVLACCPSATGRPLPGDAAGAVATVQAVQASVQSVAAGPGLGRGEAARALVATLLERPGPPLVLDADALHVFADRCMPAAREGVVLTPHPGEFAALATAFGVPAAGDDREARESAAGALAAATRCIVVLKGHGTVVAGPGGRVWVCPLGGVELAVPGSGDVLTGVTAGVLAQQVAAGCLDAFAAACAAVTAHARAGASWRREHGDRGMLARELADRIPQAVGFTDGEV